jgi:hypothetical protein
LQTDLARQISDIQIPLAQVRASSEAAQKQISKRVHRMRSDISDLQALAAGRVSRRDVEAMRQEAKADVAAVRPEVSPPMR